MKALFIYSIMLIIVIAVVGHELVKAYRRIARMEEYFNDIKDIKSAQLGEKETLSKMQDEIRNLQERTDNIKESVQCVDRKIEQHLEASAKRRKVLRVKKED